MSMMPKFVRQTLTIARRDFTATVFTPTFLLFLLMPLIMMSFSLVGGLGAANVGKSAEAKERSYAILSPADADAFAAADRALRELVPERAETPKLEIVAPDGDPATQARALLLQKDRDVPAVLYGPLAAPTIIHGNPTSTSAEFLAAVADRVLRDRAAGTAAPLSKPVMKQVQRDAGSLGGKNAASFFAVFALFLLTLMLASQVVGTMAEERSNKVIEVLAAAVPLESVFLGKLIGMFGVAILFILFWGGLLVTVTSLIPAEYGHVIADMRPAIGFPAFPLLFLAYFATAFLLLGAVFLGIGAQAATPREIQLLSLPLTLFQTAMFGLAAAAASNPDSPLTRFAEIFPFSSPFAMAAHAANSPVLWPHALALAWQLLWVALSVTIGARLFRRGVLQSAGPKFRLRRRKPDEVPAAPN